MDDIRPVRMNHSDEDELMESKNAHSLTRRRKDHAFVLPSVDGGERIGTTKRQMVDHKVQALSRVGGYGLTSSAGAIVDRTNAGGS